jgi:hypothetical protein
VDGKGEFVVDVDIDIDIEPHVQGGLCGRRKRRVIKRVGLPQLPW